MDDSLKQNVAEVLENAESYAVQLQDLLSNLKDAQTQIQQSATRTRSSIEDAFNNMKAMMIAAADHRRDELLAEVCTIQEEAQTPLLQCYDIINEKLLLASDLVDEGHKILQNEHDCAADKVVKFNDKSRSLGSLPEVPQPTQVPYISFNYDTTIASELASVVSSHGQVLRLSPVHIINYQKKPGALLLQWEEVEAESEASEFRLQYSCGDVQNAERISCNFHDIYCGSETTHLVRDLKPDVPYSFRVSCRVDGNSPWSTWSSSFVASTPYPPYAWDPSNDAYSLTNEGRIATKANKQSHLLYSRSPQFSCGHSLLFKILDCAAADRDEGLGLSIHHLPQDHTLMQSGVMFVSTEGVVSVNGKEMTTRLPRLHRGSIVAFESEGLPNKKMRVIIECEGKTVVYDWKVVSSEDSKLISAASRVLGSDNVETRSTEPLLDPSARKAAITGLSPDLTCAQSIVDVFIVFRGVGTFESGKRKKMISEDLFDISSDEHNPTNIGTDTVSRFVAKTDDEVLIAQETCRPKDCVRKTEWVKRLLHSWKTSVETRPAYYEKKWNELTDLHFENGCNVPMNFNS